MLNKNRKILHKLNNLNTKFVYGKGNASEVDKLVYDEFTIPYTMNYYYKSKQLFENKEIIVPIYITDYHQREYYYEDMTYKFDIRLDVDGTIRYIKDVQIGDYNLNIGILDVGEHYFSYEVIDTKRNLKSQRVYNQILIQDETQYYISESETLYITDNKFKEYNITVNLDENASADAMKNNRLGLTRLFKDAKSEGYRKVVLPNNVTIRVDYSFVRPGYSSVNDRDPIVIPSNFTLDMNGSTIKLHPFDDRDFDTKPSTMVVDMYNCIDTHITNGVFEGDFFERKEMIKDGQDALIGANGEFSQFLGTRGGKYNTVSDIIVKQVTGYNLITTLDNAIHTDSKALSGIAWFDNSKLLEDGNIGDVDYQSCVSDFYDLSTFKQKFDWCGIGIFLGYGGLAGEYWDVDICFYNSNKEIIDKFKSYQCREFKIPSEGVYIRVGVKSTIERAKNLSILSPFTTKYLEYNDLNFIDNRTCVAPTRFVNFRMNNCKFTRSGESITPLAVDLEDGWEQMQDFYFENCEIVERSKSQTGDLVVCSGLNMVFQNNLNCSYEFRTGVKGITVRNNVFYEGRSNTVTTNYRSKRSIRVYDNEFNNSLANFGFTGDTIFNPLSKIKYCNQVLLPNAWANTMGYHTYEKCSLLPLSGISRFNFISCDCYMSKVTDAYNFYIQDIVAKDCNFNIYPQTPTNLTMFALNYGNNEEYLKNIGSYSKCNFNMENRNMTIRNSMWDVTSYTRGEFEECTFSMNKLIFALKYENNFDEIKFSRCKFDCDVVFDLLNTKISFYNCIFKSVSYLNNCNSNVKMVNCIE